MTKTRLYLTCSLACLAIATGWIAGCGSKSTPTGPTVSAVPPTVTALIVKSNAALTAPGQTTQLTLEATLSDGSKKDVTSTATWQSSNKNVVTVSPAGLAMAVDFGKTIVNGIIAGRSSPGLVMTVLPEGTYILAGRVTEGGNLSIADARVETIGGPMSGRVVVTDGSGNYAFNGVSGVVQVRATKDGYQPATQSVTQDTEHVNVGLTPSVPYASLGGIYSLTFTASPSCNLPDDVVKRRYTATIDQRGASLTIFLSDAQFGVYFSQTWNTFSGRVLGNTVSFTLNAGYDALYLGGVAEKLGDSRYVLLAGTADGAVSGSTISTAFAGAVSVLTSMSNFWGPTLTCAAPDHHLIFTRTAATTSRKRF